MRLILLSLSSLWILIHGESIDFNIEKADLIQQPFIDWGTVRLTKANRTHYVGKGNFKILQEVNDNITVGLVFFQMQGGEYRKMPYKLGPKKLCEFVKNDKLVVPEVLATTNVPKAETCPFPAGDYIAYGYYPDISKAPAFFNGRFKMIAYFEHDGTRYNIMEGFATLQHYM